MKKKICYFVVIFLMVFLATGCKNGEITRGIRHAGFTVSETEFTCSEFLPKDEEDTTYAKIWYYNGSQIITESGIIYDVSLDMPFANAYNLRRILLEETSSKNNYPVVYLLWRIVFNWTILAS